MKFEVVDALDSLDKVRFILDLDKADIDAVEQTDANGKDYVRGALKGDKRHDHVSFRLSMLTAVARTVESHEEQKERRRRLFEELKKEFS